MKEEELEQKIDRLADVVERHNKILRVLKEKVDELEVRNYEEENLPPTSKFQPADEVQ